MLKFARISAAAMLIACLGATVQAAPATDFYSTLLRRGVAAFDAGKHTEAVHNLRIAAFGFVDALDQYQIAQTYLALAHGGLGDESNARDALKKIVAAERQNGRFAVLELPGAVREAIHALAARLLTPMDVAILRQPARVETARATQPQRASPSQNAPQARTQTQTTSAPRPVEVSPASTTPPQTRQAVPPAATQTPARPTPPPVTEPVRERQSSTPPAPPREAAPATPDRTTAPAPAPRPGRLSESETIKRLANADRALSTSKLSESRAIYRELLERGTLSRPQLLRVAEGLYRSRDFEPALEAFERLGALGEGEEPYRYYVAVALYETGRYARAKEVLRSALPFIEVTPDVARYQAKIEGAG